jgi:hypothetical protein
VGPDNDARSSQLAGHDVVRFGSSRPRRGHRPSWLAVAAGLVAAVLVAVAVVVIAHGRKPGGGAPPPVAVTDLGHPLLGVRAGWELFGRGPGEVVRIQLARGRITRTRVPALQSSGPAFFVAGPHQVIIRPLDFVPGYVIPDGHPARGLPGAPSGGPMIEGPAPGQAWVVAGAEGHTVMSLVRLDGSKIGVSIPMPGGDSWPVASDGGGYLLVSDADGVYDARPGGLRWLTRSDVAAVGPTGWLTVSCDNRGHCTNILIEAASGARRIIPGPPAQLMPPPGVISPDGSTAAIFRFSRVGNVTLHLLNLTSGADRPLAGSPTRGPLDSQTLAWSPDSRWLFVVAANGKLIVVDPRTGHVGGLGAALPQLSQLAVRSAPG